VETPTGNVSDVFFILEKNNERPDWMTDLKHTLTPHGKKMHVKEIYVIFIHLFDSGILLIIDLNKKKGEKGGGGEFYL
jgi:hypothetical protein